MSRRKTTKRREPVRRSEPRAAETDAEALVAAARAARARAHAPYSGLSVGAALLGHDGRVIAAANVESASYGLTCCAERAALFKAVSEGVRRFRALAIAVDRARPLLPCGACRQVLSEFAPRLEVVCAGRGRARVRARLDELLPRAFRPGDVLRGRAHGRQA